LGLHQQHLKREVAEDMAFTIEFRILNKWPQDDPGYLELGYIELNPPSPSPVVGVVNGKDLYIFLIS
jgi:hypothetical protein